MAPGGLPQIADATLAASDEGLDRAKGDEGLAFCVFLMTQITRAAREKDFRGALERAGLPLPPGQPQAGGQGEAAGEPAFTVFDLVSGFSGAVDEHLRRSRSRTDIGELAQLAANESLTALCAAPSESLWGSTERTVQSALGAFATKKGFSLFAHDFFARLTRRYLEYHLGRELSNHVGPNRRFASAREHNEFLRQLDAHCRVATGVVRKFAGEWYSLHNFQKDITLRKARGFAAHAVDKVREALKYQETRGDD
ncbi:MAG: hypothetical protein IPM64_10530 [Phycisphaerales bacterium]|nr:hypothetical protein [Phycisphaerales bacterium]